MGAWRRASIRSRLRSVISITARVMALLRGWMRERQKQIKQGAIPLKLSQLAEKRERLTDALIDRLITRDVFE